MIKVNEEVKRILRALLSMRGDVSIGNELAKEEGIYITYLDSRKGLGLIITKNPKELYIVNHYINDNSKLIEKELHLTSQNKVINYLRNNVY